MYVFTYKALNSSSAITFNKDSKTASKSGYSGVHLPSRTAIATKQGTRHKEFQDKGIAGEVKDTIDLSDDDIEQLVLPLVGIKLQQNCTKDLKYLSSNADKKRKRDSSGSTVRILLIRGRVLFDMSLGDSQAYYLRIVDKLIYLDNLNDNLDGMAEAVRYRLSDAGFSGPSKMGRLTPDPKHPDTGLNLSGSLGDEIYTSVGVVHTPRVTKENLAVTECKHEVILVTTDGVPDDKINKIIEKIEAADYEDYVAGLVKLGQKYTNDDVTAVLTEVEDEKSTVLKFIGVFDGHGDSVIIAKNAAENFFPFLQDQIQFWRRLNRSALPQPFIKYIKSEITKRIAEIHYLERVKGFSHRAASKREILLHFIFEIDNKFVKSGAPSLNVEGLQKLMSRRYDRIENKFYKQKVSYEIERLSFDSGGSQVYEEFITSLRVLSIYTRQAKKQHQDQKLTVSRELLWQFSDLISQNIYINEVELIRGHIPKFATDFCEIIFRAKDYLSRDLYQQLCKTYFAITGSEPAKNMEEDILLTVLLKLVHAELPKATVLGKCLSILLESGEKKLVEDIAAQTCRYVTYRGNVTLQDKKIFHEASCKIIENHSRSPNAIPELLYCRLLACITQLTEEPIPATSYPLLYGGEFVRLASNRSSVVKQLGTLLQAIKSDTVKSVKRQEPQTSVKVVWESAGTIEQVPVVSQFLTDFAVLTNRFIDLDGHINLSVSQNFSAITTQLILLVKNNQLIPQVYLSAILAVINNITGVPVPDEAQLLLVQGALARLSKLPRAPIIERWLSISSDAKSSEMFEIPKPTLNKIIFVIHKYVNLDHGIFPLDQHDFMTAWANAIIPNKDEKISSQQIHLLEDAREFSNAAIPRFTYTLVSNAKKIEWELDRLNRIDNIFKDKIYNFTSVLLELGILDEKQDQKKEQKHDEKKGDGVPEFKNSLSQVLEHTSTFVNQNGDITAGAFLTSCMEVIQSSGQNSRYDLRLIRKLMLALEQWSDTFIPLRQFNIIFKYSEKIQNLQNAQNTKELKYLGYVLGLHYDRMLELDEKQQYSDKLKARARENLFSKLLPEIGDHFSYDEKYMGDQKKRTISSDFLEKCKSWIDIANRALKDESCRLPSWGEIRDALFCRSRGVNINNVDEIWVALTKVDLFSRPLAAREETDQIKPPTPLEKSIS